MHKYTLIDYITSEDESRQRKFKQQKILAQNYEAVMLEKQRQKQLEKQSAMEYIKMHNQEVKVEDQRYKYYYNTKRKAIREILDSNK